MKYFFLTLILLCVLVVGLLGFRGEIFHTRPLQVFPDMDVQDKILGQEASPFFADGQGARLPVAGSVPSHGDDGVFPVEFGEGRDGYYYTGSIDDYWGSGMPEELGLTADNVESFLRRGHERYEIHCAPCHGSSGDGKGITSYFGVPGIANLHVHPPETSPDGKIYDAITNGKGQMGAYGSILPVRDRWAIVAYIRALQSALKAPASADAATQDSSTASN